MIQELCSFMFGGHKKCKAEIHQLLQANMDESRKVKSLESLVTKLLNQIQELKAMNHYQVSELEKQITELQSNTPKQERESIETKENDVDKVVVLEANNSSPKYKIKGK